MKVAIGLIIIVLSFAYLIKNPSQSMMDALMKKKKKSYEELQARLAVEAAAKEEAQKLETAKADALEAETVEAEVPAAECEAPVETASAEPETEKTIQ